MKIGELPAHHVKVKGTFSKDQIKRFLALQGSTNSVDFVAGKQLYEPRTIRFETFAGMLQDEHYRGHHLFTTGEFHDDPAADLNDLPGMGA